MRRSHLDLYYYYEVADKEFTLAPTWDGTGGAVEKERYLQEAKAYELGTKEDDRKLCGVRLWRNLRGDAKDVLQDIDLDQLAAEGAKYLYFQLETAYPEGRLRQLPRLFRAFFREVKFRGGMELFISETM